MTTPQVPPGVNLADNQGPNIIAGVIVMSVLGFIALAFRLISTKMIGRKLTLSDYLVILGLTFSWVDSGLVIYSVTLGLGHHMEIVPLSNIEQFLFTAIFQEIFYTLSLVCTKISILFFYRQIFANAFKWTSYSIMAAVIMWGIALILVSIFSCTPIQGFWQPLMQPPPQCINSRAFYIGNAVPNIIMDLAILSLPVRRVLKLQMKSKSKVAVCGLFLLGGFVVVASAVRLANLLSVSTEDATWGFVGVSLWSCIEMDAAVISACLPTIRPLLSEVPVYFSRIRSYATSSRSQFPSSQSRTSRGQTLDHEELSSLPKSANFRDRNGSGDFDQSYR